MSIKKVSTLGIISRAQYIDASASTNKIVDVPDAPIIGSASKNSINTDVSFTSTNSGGIATSYTITSYPGSVTATGATSPITVSGLTSGTAYTFTVKGTNSTGTGPESSQSASYTVPNDPVWIATPIIFNTSGNYTASANVDQIAVIAMGGGYPGASGNSGYYVGGNVDQDFAGSAGAGGTAGSAYSGFSGTSIGGQSFNISIGGSGGGASSVGSLLTSNGTGNASSKTAGNSINSNSAGNVAITIPTVGTQTIAYGGGGGVPPYGGGFGATQGQFAYNARGGNGGTGGLTAGGGGGGGGGGGNGAGGSGGAGGPGRVYIYEKKT